MTWVVLFKPIVNVPVYEPDANLIPPSPWKILDALDIVTILLPLTKSDWIVLALNSLLPEYDLNWILFDVSAFSFTNMPQYVIRETTNMEDLK